MIPGSPLRQNFPPAGTQRGCGRCFRARPGGLRRSSPPQFGLRLRRFAL